MRELLLTRFLSLILVFRFGGGDLYCMSVLLAVGLLLHTLFIGGWGSVLKASLCRKLLVHL